MSTPIPPTKKEIDQQQKNYHKDMKMVEECIEFAKTFRLIKQPDTTPPSTKLPKTHTLLDSIR